MTQYGVPLGNLFNIVHLADGITIPLTRATAVTFCTFEDDGTTIATITEVDSTAVNAEQALDVNMEPVKGPGVGGTWTAMAEQDDTLSLVTDAVNDSMVFTVHADQLSDGYDGVQCSVDGGVVVAITTGLTVKRAPANLASNIVA